MRSFLFRLVIGGLALIIGIGVSVLCRGFRRHPVALAEKAAVQLSAPHAVSGRGDQKGDDTTDPDDYLVRGRYSHFDYAYSVLVPAGMIGATTETWHGFGIDLTHPTAPVWWTRQKDFPRAYLSVEGSYNSAELASLDDAVKWSVNTLKENYVHTRLVSKTSTRLGGLRALRFVASYDEGSEAMIKDEIIAFRTEHGADIVYSIDLTTSASRYAQDKSLVTRMQKSFLADPLPDVYPLLPVHEERK